jgi:hypothetical protein
MRSRAAEHGHDEATITDIRLLISGMTLRYQEQWCKLRNLTMFSVELRRARDTMCRGRIASRQYLWLAGKSITHVDALYSHHDAVRCEEAGSYAPSSRRPTKTPFIPTLMRMGKTPTD